MKSQYPPVKVERQNPACAKLMLSNVGGEDSEMSAVSLYFYNSLVTQETPEISEAFHRVSIEEMRHLQIFGSLALALGEDPRLWEARGRKKAYWSPKHIRYSTKPRQIVATALYSEYMAIEKYKSQLKQIEDTGVRELLERIIEEEQAHVRLFKEMLKAI